MKNLLLFTSREDFTMPRPERKAKQSARLDDFCEKVHQAFDLKGMISKDDFDFFTGQIEKCTHTEKIVILTLLFKLYIGRRITLSSSF